MQLVSSTVPNWNRRQASPHQGSRRELLLSRGAGISAVSDAKETSMKNCAQCNGRLGLGVRFCNRWMGSWWKHLRFCSQKCKAAYEHDQYLQSSQNRWFSFLGGTRA